MEAANLTNLTQDTHIILACIQNSLYSCRSENTLPINIFHFDPREGGNCRSSSKLIDHLTILNIIQSHRAI